MTLKRQFTAGGGANEATDATLTGGTLCRGCFLIPSTASYGVFNKDTPPSTSTCPLTYHNHFRQPSIIFRRQQSFPRQTFASLKQEAVIMLRVLLIPTRQTATTLRRVCLRESFPRSDTPGGRHRNETDASYNVNTFLRSIHDACVASKTPNCIERHNHAL